MLNANTLITSTFATLLAATAAFAAGSDDSTPPSTTKTTTQCTGGMIFDTKTGTCVKVDASNVTDDMRYEAARELAYNDAYDRAMVVLASAENQEDPRILNYYGFTNRKLGNLDAAETYYQAAIDLDPDYILARSYYGQGLMVKGDKAGAHDQLREIAQRGGRDTWAYASLKLSISGSYSDY